MARISAIELAMKNEEREMAFYLNEAKHAINPLAKYMFETLAADEKDHINLLRKLHAKLTADGTWPKEVPMNVAGNNVKATVENVVKRHGSKVAHADSDTDALRKGIQFEAEAVRFYGEVADACADPAEENFFRYLAKIEHQHMSAIEDALLYLEDPSAWKTCHEAVDQ